MPSQKQASTIGIHHTFVEEVVKQQRLQVGLLDISGGDVLQENALKDVKIFTTRIFNDSDHHTLMMHPPRHILAMPA